MTTARYSEFENRNAYRNYPFAETAVLTDTDGVEFATDIFIDAFLYPVVQSVVKLYFTTVDFSLAGQVEITLGNTDNVLTGSAQDGTVELYDLHNRHAGTLVCGPGWEREIGTARCRQFEGVEFAPSVVAPIVHKGVLGFTTPDGISITTRKNVEFVGDGCITPILEEKSYGPELSFDVQDQEYKDKPTIVRQLCFAVVGNTIFDITDTGPDTVLVTTPNLDREDVCWQAHQEDAVAVVVDTCEAEVPDCPTETLPFKYTELWKCPSSAGTINLIADDVIGLKNAVHVRTVQGTIRQNSLQPSSTQSVKKAIAEGSKLLSRQIQIGNGIQISVPGLSNGR